METGHLGNDEKFVAELQDCAKLLIDKLQNNHYQDASNLIHSLYEVRDRHIFQSVGKLTRALHDAIVNFHVDADLYPEARESEIRDATDRLQYVIKMTQDAANKTMDRVEAAAPIAVNLGQEAHALKMEWEKLRRRELSKQDFARLYGRVDDFLEQMDEGSNQLSQNLQAIILEQGFQDLTGQVLKKVIGLITDVEKELVNLVRIAGQVEEVAGLAIDKPPASADKPSADKSRPHKSAAEGPQIHARPDVVNGQDEVDDLLSSLGF
jgi:chemotaxis protein CheZ